VDGVITVVNLEQVLSLQEREAALAKNQVSGCNIIVLNKVDLDDEEGTKVADVQKWIQGIKPNVPILKASYGKLPPPVLIGQKGLPKTSALMNDALLVPSVNKEEHNHAEQLFETWCYESTDPMNMSAFQHLLGILPSALFCVKGFIFAKNKPLTKLLFQMVGKRAVVSEHAWAFAGRSKTSDKIGFHCTQGHL